MAIIAAIAFLTVPAAMYVSNPEFTCSDEPEPEVNYLSDSDNDEEKKIANTDDKDEKKSSDDREDEEPQTKVDAAQFHRERLLKAAEEVLGPQDPKPTTNTVPKISPVPRKWEDLPKREPYVPSTPTRAAPTQEVAPYTPQATVPISPLPVIAGEADDSFNKTTPRRESDVRSNSAYRMRLSHLQQQQEIFKQHQEVMQNARSISPQKYMPPNREQSKEAPKETSDEADKPVSNGHAQTPITPAPAAKQPAVASPAPAPALAPIVPAVPVTTTPAVTKVPSPKASSPPRVPSPKAAVAAPRSSSPVALPPLPPKKREEVSPVRTTKPAPVSTTSAPAPSAVFPKPSAQTSSAEPYLTPRAKQQKALAELRRQEEEQRNLAKSLIQEELARALEDLHTQEAIQKLQDEREHNLLLEEQRRRESVQLALLEEKRRIQQEEDQRREERKRLQEQQRDQEEEQRLADQRAMAELLREVENERAAEEKRLQEEQMNRVQRMLKSEEQRQNEILEQLRQQNQYPSPRSHSSAILTALNGNAAEKSPPLSPAVSPASSMRLARSPAPISPATGTTRESSNDSGPEGSPRNSNANAVAAAPVPEETVTPPRRSNVSPQHPAPNNRLSTGSTGSAGKPSAIPVRAGSASAARSRTEEIARLRAERQRLVDDRLEERRTSSQRDLHQQAELEREFAETKEHHNGTDHLHSTLKTKETLHITETVTETVRVSSASKVDARTLSAQRARVQPASPQAPSTPQTPQSSYSPQSPISDLDEDESADQQALNAREELAMRIDTYIRSQKKYSSAAPLKYKCPVSKILSDCDKFRKAYNQTTTNEALRVKDLLHFMEKHPRFNVSGGHQMVGVTQLTPFQSSNSRRVYGHFKCSKCIKYWMEGGVNKSDNREWQNAYSYKNCYQTCHVCDVKVYPYIQRNLRDSERHFDDRLKHDTARCSRCETLHRPCYDVDA